MPSGNGVAACALQRLGHLLGEFRYLQAAERSLNLFYPTLLRYSGSCCSLLIALEQSLSHRKLLFFAADAEALDEWDRCVAVSFDPHILVFALACRNLRDLPLSLSKPAAMKDNTVNAWVCQGVKCLPEIYRPAGIAARLRNSG